MEPSERRERERSERAAARRVGRGRAVRQHARRAALAHHPRRAWQRREHAAPPLDVVERVQRARARVRAAAAARRPRGRAAAGRERGARRSRDVIVEEAREHDRAARAPAAAALAPTLATETVVGVLGGRRRSAGDVDEKIACGARRRVARAKA